MKGVVTFLQSLKKFFLNMSLVVYSWSSILAKNVATSSADSLSFMGFPTETGGKADRPFKHRIDAWNVCSSGFWLVRKVWNARWTPNTRRYWKMVHRRVITVTVTLNLEGFPLVAWREVFYTTQTPHAVLTVIIKPNVFRKSLVRRSEHGTFMLEEPPFWAVCVSLFFPPERRRKKSPDKMVTRRPCCNLQELFPVFPASTFLNSITGWMNK